MELVTVNAQQLRRWKVGVSTFLAWPERGARLMDWHIEMADGTIRDIIYWPHDANFENPAHIRGGNPILFPFVARTFNGERENFWKDPEGNVRPMPRHGFARDGEFLIEDISERGFTACLVPKPQDREAYPYNYNFRVRYQFLELAFQVDLILENLSSQPIPWCAGHHFYFALPWHAGLTRKDYLINIPAKKGFYHMEDGRLAPAPDFAPQTDFSDPKLVDRIHTKLQSNTVSFGPKSGEENINIVIGRQPVPSTWNTVTTWTESPESPFYCVEPWMGPPNAPAQPNGLHLVEPGKSSTFTVEVNVY